jgi:hypothetical protein
VAYWLEFGLSFIDNGNSAIRWRFPIAFQIIPLLVLFAICWFFPESPRWLAKVGRDEEARYILRRLRGSEGDDAVRAEAEFQDIKNSVIHERQTARSNTYFSMLFGVGSGKLHTGRRVQLVIWLQIMQEWVGIAGVTVYVSRGRVLRSDCIHHANISNRLPPSSALLDLTARRASTSLTIRDSNHEDYH